MTEVASVEIRKCLSQGILSASSIHIMFPNNGFNPITLEVNVWLTPRGVLIKQGHGYVF